MLPESGFDLRNGASWNCYLLLVSDHRHRMAGLAAAGSRIPQTGCRIAPILAAFARYSPSTAADCWSSHCHCCQYCRSSHIQFGHPCSTECIRGLQQFQTLCCFQRRQQLMGPDSGLHAEKVALISEICAWSVSEILSLRSFGRPGQVGSRHEVVAVSRMGSCRTFGARVPDVCDLKACCHHGCCS